MSFSRDVMAVISKAGCNAGGCHGNQNGKGGFKLSLWGGDLGETISTPVGKGVLGRIINVTGDPVDEAGR